MLNGSHVGILVKHSFSKFYPFSMNSESRSGKIARAVAETFWGKVVLVGITLFFLPLIIYTLLKEHRAKKRVINGLFR